MWPFVSCCIAFMIPGRAESFLPWVFFLAIIGFTRNALVLSSAFHFLPIGTSCRISAAIRRRPIFGHAARSAGNCAGFCGGYVKHDNAVHAEVQLAARLRAEYPAGVHVDVFENHRGKQALREVLQLLDTKQEGSLSESEKQHARIILYGHSWGASEAIQLARSLGAQGIPVLLTVQVDSVAKKGENDSIIPPNVAQAANL
jgi:hypothetical protein